MVCFLKVVFSLCFCTVFQIQGFLGYIWSWVVCWLRVKSGNWLETEESSLVGLATLVLTIGWLALSWEPPLFVFPLGVCRFLRKGSSCLQPGYPHSGLGSVWASAVTTDVIY